MEDVMQLIDGGASPDQVLSVWEESLSDDSDRYLIEQLNSMLVKCVELDNTALTEAICSHWIFHKNSYRLRGLCTGGSGGAAYKAVCANNIALAKIMLKAGYFAEYAFCKSKTSDIGRFLVSEEVHTLILDRADTEVIMSAWEHDHNDDTDMLKDEQCQWMMCMCVEQNNIKLAEAICQPYMNGKKFHCFDYLSPLKDAAKERNDAIVRCLLRAGMEPIVIALGLYAEIALYLIQQYLSEEVQILVNNKASAKEIMEAWERHHVNDLPKVQNEQLNWLLIKSIQQNNLDFAKVICGHQLFPKKPSHVYKNNSPLYEAVKIEENDDMISLLLQAGYDPSDTFRDAGHWGLWRDLQCGLYYANLLEEALVNEKVDYIKVIMVDHKAYIKDGYRLSLLNFACRVCDEYTLDRFLALGLYTPLEMNKRNHRNSYPIFMIGARSEKRPMEDLMQVLLKYGADPFLMDEHKGTVLEYLCISLKEDYHDYCEKDVSAVDEYEWEKAFELIQLLLDKGVGFSERKRCEPLLLFCSISPTEKVEWTMYEKIFSQLVQMSPKMVIDAMFTCVFRAMGIVLLDDFFMLFCEHEAFCLLSHTTIESRSIQIEHIVEKVKYLSARMQILIECGATWDSVGADELLDTTNETNIVNILCHVDSTLRSHFPSYVTHISYKQSVTYILKVFPYAAKQLVQSEKLYSDFISLLSGDQDLFGPFLVIYFDFLPPAEKSHVLERLAVTLAKERRIDADTKASLMQWLQRFVKCCQGSDQRETRFYKPTT